MTTITFDLDERIAKAETISKRAGHTQEGMRLLRGWIDASQNRRQAASGRCLGGFGGEHPNDPDTFFPLGKWERGGLPLVKI